MNSWTVLISTIILCNPGLRLSLARNAGKSTVLKVMTRRPMNITVAQALFGASFVVSCLGTNATLGQNFRAADPEPVVLTFTVEGIRPLDNSYVLLSLTPVGTETSQRPRYAPVDISDCSQRITVDDRCGKATIVSDPVNPVLEYIVTVCQSFQTQNPCGITPGGDDTVEAGQTGRIIDPSNDTRYRIDLRNEYQ